jgi:hypothetical protein
MFFGKHRFISLVLVICLLRGDLESPFFLKRCGSVQLWSLVLEFLLLFCSGFGLSGVGSITTMAGASEEAKFLY